MRPLQHHTTISLSVCTHQRPYNDSRTASRRRLLPKPSRGRPLDEMNNPHEHRTPRGDRRRRVRRAVRGPGARARPPVQRHAHRSPQLPPVPAACSTRWRPGRCRRPTSPPRCAASCAGSATPACCSARWSDFDLAARDVVLADGRVPYDSLIVASGRHAPLLRPSRMGIGRPRAEDHRGRDHHPPPRAQRLRAGRTLRPTRSGSRRC